MHSSDSTHAPPMRNACVLAQDTIENTRNTYLHDKSPAYPGRDSSRDSMHLHILL